MESPIFSSWPAGQWFLEYNDPDDFCAFRCSQVLAEGRTAYQQYAIIASPPLGKALILDGVLQSALVDEFIYHEALVHPVMCCHEAPQHVAVLGGGEGATIREVLRHAPVQRVDMIDLDAELVALCRRYLPEFGAGAWDDPRLKVQHTDGRAWLADQPEASLDVIIMDITDPLEGGPAYFLFTQEMFHIAQRKLRPGGAMSIQAGSAGQAIRLLPHLHRTLQAVFPQVIPYTAYIPSFNDQYGFLLAGDTACIWPSPEQTRRILATRGITALRWFDPDFAMAPPLLPPYLRQLLRREGQILTDAQPLRQARPFSLQP